MLPEGINNKYYSIIRQENNVDLYAQNLAYQRDAERSGRSQWVGGGFGVKGAIKGAVTAGALNAATGIFRSIGDGITDASDRSTLQSKYNAIINENNKESLVDAFTECLSEAEGTFFEIVGTKTGWNPDGVLGNNDDEGIAKLHNLDNINDNSLREKIVIELLSEYPFLDDVIEYALSNYEEYDFNVKDVLHYVNRLNPMAFRNWMEYEFIDYLEKIGSIESGENRIKAIIDRAITFGVIDSDLKIIDFEVGPLVIMHLMETEMSDNGLGLDKMQYHTYDLNRAQIFFDKLDEIGKKYHVFNQEEGDNKFSLSDTFQDYEDFEKLENAVNKEWKRTCTVRDVLCENIQEAMLLNSEWKEFDELYSPYDTYADYDSKEMQHLIDRIEKKCFKTEQIKKLIYGPGGLKEKKEKLEKREKSEEYRKSQQIVKIMLPYAGSDLIVFRSNGYLEKVKEVREKLKELDKDDFIAVICDKSDSNGFKGFIVTEYDLYNYNSSLGFGFGDKKIRLKAIREAVNNGKKWEFKDFDGSTEKIKIIEYEELLIGALSKTYNWISDVSFSKVLKQPCPRCGKMISIDSKFCTYCGTTIIVDQSI